MDLIRLNYSTKNIPIAPQHIYRKQLINKTENFLKRMRWKALFYLNPDLKSISKETYGFNSRKSPPPIKEMTEFENKLIDIISNVEFVKKQSTFQSKLRSDVNDIRKDDKLLIKADKTNNYYKIDVNEYNNLIQNSITKTYKKAPPSTVKNIDTEAKYIAEKLELQDRIEKLAEKESFITLKDHKPNFINKPTCRLLNPTKSELGRVSKVILEKITKSILTATNLNLWKKTKDVIDWFQTSDKRNAKFITFDVVEFYQSITEKLLKRALEFAKDFTPISDDEIEIIIHAKRSVLFNSNSVWIKKGSEEFDVTMGSFDGAETCEIVACYMLSILNAKYPGKFGLYRDDGLGILTEPTKKVEQIKKDICSMFRENELRITIDANKTRIDYLDVTFDIKKESYQPFIKPNSIPTYVHSNSNHPPSVLNNIPYGINKRLSNISSSKEIFDHSKTIYQEALNKSDYIHQLTYSLNHQNPRPTRRTREITWYTPPFDLNVKTKIGSKFLKLVKSYFNKQHPLHKIFNTHTLKISYSCMPNIKKIIDKHNKGLIKNAQKISSEALKKCNCRNAIKCPLDGQCLTESVIYQATVTSNNNKETYVGLTENQFKTRYRNHTASFRNKKLSNATELSKHIWSLKDTNQTYNIKWKILCKSQPYSNTTKRCDLCNTEKYYIIFQGEMASLNKRTELICSCRHSKKYLLENG